MVLVLLAAAFYKNIEFPSALVWGKILKKLGPMRAHHVLEHNKKVEDEEAGNWHARWRARRQHFRVNWGYLSVETQNTSAFLRALRFEKQKIKSTKPGLKYAPLEVAVLALIEEATDLRWEQVRWQFILQFRSRLGLKVDKETFNVLLAHYKFFEEHMLALALAEGQWLHQMLMERLGLTEWRVIEGGQEEPA
ncbi:MAG TPA: hypothetical protein VI636_09665 [Candidatus Angelobacter sp.]